MTSESSTSVSLLARVRKLDHQAWERLAFLYGPLVYRWCRRMGVSDHDAADLVQEVFQTVALKIELYKGTQQDSSFRGWLRTIARNKTLDFFRRQAKNPTARGGSSHHQQIENLPDLVDDDPNEDDFNTTGSVAHRALSLVRDEFEEYTWQAFQRTALDGQAPADVARDLGMSVGAVYTAKSRLLKRIREELDGMV
jgi:RNA polymerase sigma-70 factor (ECF subfamily)